MRTITFALAPLAILAVACSASVESDPTGATSEAIIPIWLPSCDTEALSTPSVGKAINEQIGNCAWSNEVSSPSASYGGEWCSSTYVIEVDKLSKAEAFNVFGGPTGYPGTSAVCAATHSALTVWAHSAAGWTTLGSNMSHGKWESGSLFSICTFVNDWQTGTFTVKGNEGFDEIRIGVSAWEAETVNGKANTRVYVPVTGGISGGATC